MSHPLSVPVLLLFLTLLPATVQADRVVPSDQVRTRVVVRDGYSRRSAEIGSLRPGDQAELLSSVEGWHRVRLAGGAPGFVSQAWTRVIPEPTEAAPSAGLGDSVRGLLRSAGAFFKRTPPVDFVLREPAVDQGQYRDREPRLPVSGYATAGGGTYDIVVAIDASTSTKEFSQADIDGDGQAEDVWEGPDSIFQAEIAAASELVRALGELPGNRNGERIRVGVVSFAGDDRFHRRPEDRKFPGSREAIYALAERDAELRIPLSRDYDRVQRELRRMAATEPEGMTNFAAGIGRALFEFDALEPAGEGDASEPPAERLILFLTDGKPRLPFDPDVAERAALRAAGLAAEFGVRIHSFTLSEDVVTRAVGDAVRGMARRTGGRLVQLEEPGEIVSLLRSTAFSHVEQVKLANLTRSLESDSIATGIDGSFYGEIGLESGANEIEVVALLNDGTTATKRFVIDYEQGAPPHEMRQRLAALREENRALIDQIHRRLNLEMEQVRKKRAVDQQKALDLVVANQAP